MKMNKNNRINALLEIMFSAKKSLEELDVACEINTLRVCAKCSCGMITEISKNNFGIPSDIEERIIYRYSCAYCGKDLNVYSTREAKLLNLPKHVIQT